MAENGSVAERSFVRFNPMTSFLAVLNTNDEDDTNFILARYFLDHFHEIPRLSIYQIAEECFTSRSSVQRFLKSIGYDTFTELKDSIAEVKDHQRSYLTYVDHTDFPNYIRGKLDAMMDDINRMAEKQKLIRLAEKIHDSETVFIVNAEDSSSAARIFQQQLLSMDKLVRLVTSSAHTNPEVLRKLSEKDCVITCSASGNFALMLDREISEVKAYKALITLNRTMMFENSYDWIFYLSETLQPSNRSLLKLRNVYTRYGMAYFFDLLFHLYFRRYQNELRPE